MPNSYVTSYAALFDGPSHGAPTVNQVEIPLIQRDYAQGRPDGTVATIRENFLDVLHDAVTGGEPIGLDFVYGKLTEGKLEPLDGQQRLTTMFLLHWYLAARTGRIENAGGWTRLSYATRPGSRVFCERLVTHQLPPGTAPSTWITDQPWYLDVWEHDPTIRSMLAMLDAIHLRFLGEELDAAWLRLVDPVNPAVSFHLLPVEDMGSAEDLYIKMNSRGKPLTDFENFKARLEKLLDGSARGSELAHRIDGAWADVLWPLRGDDNIVDDEFLRFFSFVIEMCELRHDDIDHRHLPILGRAQQVFASGETRDTDNLDFLFAAFDAWVNIDTWKLFAGLLTTRHSSSDGSEGAVVLFGSESTTNINLFEACCREYDTVRFANPRKLLLYAVLQHRIHGTVDFARRLRIVRNLVEASENEIRLDRMSRLIADVERIVIDGALDGVEAFNQAQIAEEITKQEFVAAHPELEASLFRLEDHEIVRGSTMAFDLAPEGFDDRVTAFWSVFTGATHFPALTGALLAVGEYQRQLGNMYRFGSPEQSGQWRLLLTGGSRDNLANTRRVLRELLDQVASSTDRVEVALYEVSNHWLHRVEIDGRFAWRYYLVKYDAMREGRSGVYATPDAALGFSLCMLNKQQMNSYYRDPYLHAVCRMCRAEAAVTGGIESGVDGAVFSGYASTPRWMRLRASGTQMRCVAQGFTLRPPDGPDHLSAFGSVCARFRLSELSDGDRLLEVPSELIGGELVDLRDRIVMGAELLGALLDAGL